LNGPTHALRIARAIARDFPGLTFDFTAKIEHLVTHRSAVRELKDLGCIFVVSAAESLSRRTLLAIGKGHTAEDIISTVRFFAAIGLTLRPTFVPFTPWDSLDDYRSLLRMIHDEGLVDQIDPVQYGIRLLVPPGSLLLRSGAMQPYLDGLDASLLTYRWHHPDPRMDELQKSIAGLLSATASQDPARTFFAIVARADNVASGARSRRDDRWIERHFPPDRARPPRLTESWFC
jgi:hypothetical protein